MASKAVPGYCGYAVVGDKSYEFMRDPVAFIQSRINQHSSRIFQARILNNPTIFVCSPHLVNELLTSGKSNDFEHGYRSILHRLYGDLILFESDTDAMHLRSCMEPVFKNPSIFQNQIDSVILPYIDSLRSRVDDVKVYKEFKSLMTKLCLQLFLSLDSSTSMEVCDEISSLATQHWHGIISVPLSIRIPLGGRSTFNMAVDAKDKLLDHIRIILSRATPSNQSGTTLMSRLRSAAFPRDKQTLEQHLLLFISAVIPKAFSSIITSFIVATAGPDMKLLRDRARDDSDFLDDVLLEVERLWPPLFGGRRLAKRTTVIGGYKIPKDYALFYISHSSHRDPQVFKDPDVFNPDRWTTCNSGMKHLVYAFGAGPRSCIGTKFMRHILLSITAQLLQDYDWCLSPSQSVTYKYLPVARPADEVTISFQPRLDLS